MIKLIIKMVKIYCITDCNGLNYVGRTIKTLEQRLSVHRSKAKTLKDCSSFQLNLNDCSIHVLEECNEDEMNEKEKYWINHIECVNHIKFNGTDKQKKKITDKKASRVSYIKNREKKLKYTQNRYNFLKTWGGHPYKDNNLFRIDVDLFI